MEYGDPYWRVRRPPNRKVWVADQVTTLQGAGACCGGRNIACYLWHWYYLFGILYDSLHIFLEISWFGLGWHCLVNISDDEFYSTEIYCLFGTGYGWIPQAHGGNGLKQTLLMGAILSVLVAYYVCCFTCSICYEGSVSVEKFVPWALKGRVQYLTTQLVARTQCNLRLETNGRLPVNLADTVVMIRNRTPTRSSPTAAPIHAYMNHGNLQANTKTHTHRNLWVGRPSTAHIARRPHLLNPL